MKVLLAVLKRSIWTLVSIFFALLFAAVMIAGPIAKKNDGWINKTLGINPYETVFDKNNVDEDTEWFKSDFVYTDNGEPVTVTEESGYTHQVYDDEAMRANSMEVAKRVATEGSVLLWNKDVDGKPALPLEKNAGVSFFGVGAIDYTHHGGGSGHVAITMNDTLKDAAVRNGLKVNNALWNAYRLSKADGYGRVYSKNAAGNSVSDNNYIEFKIGEVPWTHLTGKISMPSGIGVYGDAAVMVISRYGSEDGDTSFRSPECLNENYMDLAIEEEKTLAELSKLKKDGVVKRVILVVNSPAAVSMKNVVKHSVDACLWTGLAGNVSYEQVGLLLSGNASPSGHLNDTWVNDVRSAPSSENFGDYDFGSAAGLPAEAAYTHNTKYVVYQEGIYVGYRYYETRYEDSVLGRGNADGAAGVKAGSGKWSYKDEVAYSFGHGLTYTSFEQSGFKAEKNKDGDWDVSVTVKNTGNRAGKDVVQVYLQKPYTEYDKTNKIEKSAVELVGFAKTDELAPGASQTLEITVDDYEFKSYDAYGKKTYILEKGDYYLAAGISAHDALNNILAAKGKHVADGMDYEGKADFVKHIDVAADDFEKYSVSEFTGKPIENQFDNADVNLYEGTSGQKITYLSRSDWQNTYPSAVKLVCNAKIAQDMQYGASLKEDPTATIPLENQITSPQGKLTLAMLMHMPYDDPLWEHLLNQLTWEEQNILITYGSAAVAGAPSVAAPMYTSQDGPCGIRQGAGTLDTQMAFPCNGLVASTYNVKLVEELGNAFAHEILHIGCVGIYGLGANVHRNAWSGRSWEYYSEDGFLSGKIFSAESMGMTKKGVVLFTKHFALNDQERNRYGGTVWANEQSIREIYLKAFEAGVTEGHTNGFMSSFNRIGCTWAGEHKGLLTEVLRNEWGFIGQVETDAGVGAHMLATEARAAGVVAGQDIWMSGSDPHAFDKYKNNATVRTAMREACHRILYTTLHSKAMNSNSSGSYVVYRTPWWQTAITSLQITFGVLMGVCAAVTVTAFVLHAVIKPKKKIPDRRK